MKKILLRLAPVILLLTSCNNNFKVEVLNGVSHEPRFDNPSSAVISSSVSYSYTSNSSYDVSALNKVTMTFENIKTSDSEIANPQTIKSYIKLEEQFDYQISENIKHFGTKNDDFAFLGNDYNDEFGQITFTTANNIKYVVIKAQQYSYLKTAFNENALVIDEDVAIAVNDSGFIKLDAPVLNETKDQITNDTTCAFSLGEGAMSVTIKAGRKRAILKEIAFYY